MTTALPKRLKSHTSSGFLYACMF